MYPPAPEQINQLGENLHRAHGASALLQDERVAAGPGSKVQDAALAEVEGQALEGRQLIDTSEEPMGREDVGVSKIIHDEQLCVCLSALEGEQRPGVRFPAGPDGDRYVVF